MEASPRPHPVPQRRHSEPNLGRPQRLQDSPEGAPTRPVRSLSAVELQTPVPTSGKTPASPDTTGTPLSQRQARAPADPEAVRQRLRASAGLHNATRRRLDLSVIGRFDPVKNRDQAIARTLAHVHSNAARPRIVREANRPQHLGGELEGALQTLPRAVALAMAAGSTSTATTPAAPRCGCSTSTRRPSTGPTTRSPTRSDTWGLIGGNVRVWAVRNSPPICFRKRDFRVCLSCICGVSNIC